MKWQAMKNFYGLTRRWLLLCALALSCLFSVNRTASASKGDVPGPGFVTEFASPIEEVLPALQEILHDQTIHGTQIYDKDPTLTGAVVVESTPLFPPWKGEGRVFYKIRAGAIAPRHFKDSADQGTVAVRYILTSPNPGRTRLRIDAIFVENSHRAVHASDGSVEAAEAKVIVDQVRAIQFAEQEAADAQRRRESIDLAKQTYARQREDEASRLARAQASVEDLQQRVAALRHQLERRIKEPGASLKAAPFRSAANVATLSAFTEVVVVIVTPHWFGVETPDGQRGWLPVDQLDPLP
jgi:hypothetical protein